ncbi:MAG: hypothetical protein U0792_13610 [Gemmataceae bacterium]
MLNVHLRINDSQTGKPTPVRVRIAASDGTHFMPLGRSVEFPTGRNEAVGGCLKLGGERWFYTDGSCEVPLPGGVPLRVQATKGPGYHPLDETVTLGPGQLTLRLVLRRWEGGSESGWLSVDMRSHFLSPHDAVLEAAAEGIDVVNLLATVQPFPSLDGTAYQTVPNLTAFSGQTATLERHGTAVIVNTLNTHPVLGKVGLLHSHRPVFPLTFGGDEPDDWGICDWCDQCHRKGGLTVWVDAFEPAGGIMGGEALVAAILGKIDAIEVPTATRKVPLLPWVYTLWNAGVLVPLVGSSGKDSNKTLLGAMRTIVRLDDTSPPVATGGASGGWVAAIRAGRTVATSGPRIDFTVSRSAMHAAVSSLTRGWELELIANGQVVVSGVDPGSQTPATLASTFGTNCWVAARVRAANGAFAHTSPVAAGTPTRTPEAVAALRKLIEQTREWAMQHGQYANTKRREQLLARCDEAIATLETTP